MSDWIQRIHTDIRDGLQTNRGVIATGSEVPTGTHKEYPRMRRIALTAPTPLPIQLDEAIRSRRSFEVRTSRDGLSLEQLGTLLGTSLGISPLAPLRNYPSGGSMFPIETYLIGTVIDSEESGIYHYHPSAHALEYLWDMRGEKIETICRWASPFLSPTLLAFTATWERSSKKYGDFAYNLALLEAGHMAQNVLLVASALGIDARPVSGCDDRIIHSLLDIGEREQFVYGILLSRRS